jgi:hypothetical protein
MQRRKDFLYAALVDLSWIWTMACHLDLVKQMLDVCCTVEKGSRWVVRENGKVSTACRNGADDGCGVEGQGAAVGHCLDWMKDTGHGRRHGVRCSLW